MVQRLRVSVLAGVTLAAAGCSLALDFDGRRIDVDAGGTADASVPIGPSVAHFDAYHFQRGSRSFEVAATSGLLRNDGPGAKARREARSTSAGGRVEISAEGSFEYMPPGPAAAFWGNDHFEYELLGEPSSRAHVRLTVQPPALSLSELRQSGGAGFGIAGAQAQDLVGVEPTSLAPAGDVNGDGLQDFVIGVRGPIVEVSLEGGGSVDAGEGRGAYVLFGKGDANDVSLAAGASSAPGFLIAREGSFQGATGFGMAVGGAGDVNGDGLDDVIIGSSRALPEPGLGAAYVVFGKTDASPVSAEEILAGNGGGFAIRASASDGEENFALVGFDVDGAGDVNGDGLADVVVGVPFFGRANGDAGGAFVIFGKVGTEPVSVNAIAAGEPLGFPILGNTPGEFLGVRAAGLGDVNGDGLSDVAVSSYVQNAASRAGRTVVVLGKPGASAVRLAEIEAGDGTGFVLTGADADDFAANVIGAGDVNGDGLDDIAIGARGASAGTSPAPGSGLADAGAGDAGDAGGSNDAGPPLEPEPPPTQPANSTGGVVYVVFGSPEPESFNLRELERTSLRGFAISGRGRVQQLGDRLGAGDVDGDGLSDILAAAIPDAAHARAFVVFGKTSGEPVVVPPEASASAAVLTVICPPEEIACQSLASGADANGDGIDDLLIGVALYPDAPQAAGGAYLAFGWDMNRALSLAGRDAALIGDATDNVLELPEAPVVIARGGRGRDTLRPAVAISQIDLRPPGRYESLEIIDVRGNGPQRVLLDDTALRRIPESHSGFAFMMAKKLTVLGDAEDTLVFDLDGYVVRGGSAGRVVYGREGSYYGLELSQDMRVER